MLCIPNHHHHPDHGYTACNLYYMGNHTQGDSPNTYQFNMEIAAEVEEWLAKNESHDQRKSTKLFSLVRLRLLFLKFLYPRLVINWIDLSLLFSGNSIIDCPKSNPTDGQ